MTRAYLRIVVHSICCAKIKHDGVPASVGPVRGSDGTGIETGSQLSVFRVGDSDEEADDAQRRKDAKADD